jgi:hypothetical protein
MLVQPKVVRKFACYVAQELSQRLLGAPVQIDAHYFEIGRRPLKSNEALPAPEEMLLHDDQFDSFRNLREKIIFEVMVREVLHEETVCQTICPEKRIARKSDSNNSTNPNS